jgi:hypothetical protein
VELEACGRATPPIRTTDAQPEEVKMLDHETRRSKLTLHIASLVHRGAEVEEQHDVRAVVVVARHPSYLPALALAAAGVALFLTIGGIFFLFAAGAALLGWHRKLAAGVQRVRMLVRIDELGHVSEMELGLVAAR